MPEYPAPRSVSQTVKRRLRHLLTALSLLLCAAIAAAWARSAWHGDLRRGTFGQQPPLPFVELKSERGAVALTYMPASPYGPFWQRESWRHPRRWFGYGFLCYSMPYPPQARPAGAGPSFGTYYRVQAPYWSLLTAAALLPAWQTFRSARARYTSRASRTTLCPQCGYDLRATPDRCPECGTIETGRGDVRRF